MKYSQRQIKNKVKMSLAENKGLHSFKMESETTTSIIKSLVEFQALQIPIPLDKVGKVKGKNAAGKFYEYDYKYAGLDTIHKAVSKELSELGLFISHSVDGLTGVVSTLYHSSGEFIRSYFSSAPGKNGPQAIGGIVTYGKRYNISALLNLNLTEDLDGSESESQADLSKIPLNDKPYTMEILGDQHLFVEKFLQAGETPKEFCAKIIEGGKYTSIEYDVVLAVQEMANKLKTPKAKK